MASKENDNNRRSGPDGGGDNNSIRVRTIYISPLKPDMDSEIKGYFERFGAVESVAVHAKNDFRFGFVQFRSSGSAQSALENLNHYIASCPVTVKPADPWHQSDHILNALNDDCLCEIFKHLNLLDLSNAANVCIRFNLLAKEVFPVKHKHCHLSYDSGFYDKPNEVEVLLNNFGSMIQSLHVESDIISYDFLANCKELRVLRLENCNYIDYIQQQFSKIQEAHFVKSDIGDEELSRFITLNPTLTKLSVINCLRFESTQSFHCIGQNLQNLQEFEFDSCIQVAFQTDILNLGYLKYLNKLKLNFNLLPILPLMRALASNQIPIEHLRLQEGYMEADSVDSLSQFKRIQILEFSDMEGYVTNEHLIELAKELPQLQELHLKGSAIELTTIGLMKMLRHASNLSLLSLESIDSVTIDEDDYKSMLRIVLSRANSIKLKIDLTSSGGKVNVPDEISSENRRFLDINEEIEDTDDIISNDSNNLFDDYDFNDDDHDDYNEYDDDDDYDNDIMYGDEEGADHEQAGVCFMSGRRFYLG